MYGAGKAARLALTRTLAREAELVHNPWAEAQRSEHAAAAGPGGPPTIRTLSYAPGALDTDFQVGLLPWCGEGAGAAPQSAAWSRAG